MFTLGWPQIAIIVLIVISLTEAAIKNGQPKNSNHSFVVMLIAAIIEVVILRAGGFFG